MALSTTEAKYMASCDAARHAIWLRLILDDLGFGLGNKPLPLLNDNSGCIALSKNPVHHDRTKHIAMRHHFLREKVEDNTISLNYISTAGNLADLLTKALPWIDSARAWGLSQEQTEWAAELSKYLRHCGTLFFQVIVFI